MNDTKRKTVKPRLWRKGTDGQCCYGCHRPFIRGDKIRTDEIVAFHDDIECWKKHVATCKEIGIAP